MLRPVRKPRSLGGKPQPMVPPMPVDIGSLVPTQPETQVDFQGLPKSLGFTDPGPRLGYP